MKSSEANLLDSSGILKIIREAITAAHRAKDDRPSSKAILAFAVRLAGSWRSTVTLVKHHQEQDDLRSISNDCAVILRCMYDAFLQMRWIAVGPNDPDKMGQLYLGFQVIENFTLMKYVLSQKDDMSQRVASSPLRKQRHPRLRDEYDKAKVYYPNSNGKGVRKQWYPGSLYSLAKELHATEEYTWFVRVNNSSVHTGPRAMFHYSDANAHQIESLSAMVLMRGLGILKMHYRLALSRVAMEVIDAYSNSRLTASFGA